MTDEKIMLGPVAYAGLKALKAYKEAEGVYKELAVDMPEDNAFFKIFSSIADELQKSSDATAQDFMKKYQKFESVFSLALKLLG
jgi:hypothetical protein